MWKNVRDRDVKLSKFAFRSLVIFAEKSNESEMTLDVYSTMQKNGVKPSANVYSSVLAVRVKEERWSDVIKVFEEMPQGIFSRLNGTSLGHVVMAHPQSDNDELISRGLDIIGKHKEKWNKLACTAALEGLLQTEQFDVLLALANDMQRHDMKWDPSIFKMVTLAYIRSGSIDKARQFLHSNAKRMQDDSALCYRELIEYRQH